MDIVKWTDSFFFFWLDFLIKFGTQTRYCMKYRHCDGKLVLKVTDNKEV